MADFSNENVVRKLEELSQRYDELERSLSDPEVFSDPERVRELSVKRSGIADIVERYRRYRSLAEQIEEDERIVAESDDPELRGLAQEELEGLKPEAEGLLEAITHELVTADDRAVGSVILEVRAAAGGAEAAIWAGELLAMYQQYADRHGWQHETLSFSPSDQGGVREAIANVSGPGVWQGLGYEGGVHCVKRVPETESQGRIHTSTATVAVMPEPEAVSVDIPDEDVETHVTTAQGPGGQNVNKVASAVHMVHKPTGIEVRMQESKSQHQNRDRAWRLLKARVHDAYERERAQERADQRGKMIGSGGRSERIRTYRFKDNMVVDHRLGRSFNLEPILAGDLDDVVEALVAQDRANRLAAM